MPVGDVRRWRLGGKKLNETRGQRGKFRNSSGLHRLVLRRYSHERRNQMHVLQPKARRRLPKEVAQQTRLKQHRRRVKALPTFWIQSTSGCPASTRGCPWSRSCTVNLNP